MPSDKEIEIILRLRDEVTKVLQGVQQNIHRFSNQVKELGIDMRKTGREISSMGSTMALAGTTITAPLIAAYKEAGKYNADIAQQLNETKNVFQRLSVSIGTALLPVMREITDQVAKMVSWWNNLDKATRDKIVVSIFTLGKNLILLGTAFVVVGKSISFLGNLAKLTSTLMSMNPVVLAAAATFVVLSVAMLKSKAIADGVYFAFAKITQILTGGMINIDWKRMSNGLDDFKKSFMDIAGMYKDFIDQLGKSNWEEQKKPEGTFFSGFRLGLEQTREALASWRDMGLKTANDLFSGMQSNFKSLFVDGFHGQLKTAKQYFAAFGETILNIFADVCSQIITTWITTMAVTGLVKAFSAATSVASLGSSVTPLSSGTGSVAASSFGGHLSMYHSGGIVRAHGGLNLASDEVPIIAQTGERILSRSQNREYEKGSRKGDIYITINPTSIIKAYDFADVYAHKEQFEAMMAESIDLNKLRKVINANR